MAAAGVVLRAVRWVTNAASAAVAARRRDGTRGEGWRDTNNHKYKEAVAGAGVGKGERGGAGERLRRARESVMLQAEGTRVPLDVIHTLNEAELEVRRFFMMC